MAASLIAVCYEQTSTTNAVCNQYPGNGSSKSGD